MAFIIYKKKGRVAYITINRPEVLNAKNNQTKREFNEALANFNDDPDLWIGVISGTGGQAFSVGSDVKEMAELMACGIDPFATAEPEELMWGLIDVWKPLVVAIDGWCVGGGLELALACDIRIASETSQFGLMEPKLGWTASAGGTVRLPNQIPFAVAMEMILTGDTVGAQRAYEIGLINQIVPSKKDVMAEVERMVERILTCAPLAIRFSKEQALRSFNLPNYLGLPLRKIGSLEISNSSDAKEGARAFAEKRTPEWKGK